MRASPIFLLLIASASVALAAPAAKKLIEFGWDEPSTEFMRQHIGEMEQTPFHGVVFNAAGRRTNGAKIRFTWEAWSTNRFEKAEMQRAVDDLQATKFRRFTDNFLRFNTTPAKLDWFDDYSAVIHNCRVAAWVAKAGGAKGLLFDIEQYEGQLFDFRKQRDGKARGWNAYAAKVRERGREVMAAFQEEYPGAVIFLTFGYSLPWLESAAGKGPLSDCHYGLLAPFLDGMLEAAKPPAVLVDGNESAYPFRELKQFTASYKAMKQDLLPIVATPDEYLRRFSFGYGLWLDYNWRKFGWDTNDLSKNYFSPQTFQQSLTAALQSADEYVWLYTEQPRWWSETGGMIKMPQQYIDAIRAAQRDAQSANPK